MNADPPSFIDTPMLRASEEDGFLGPGGRDPREDHAGPAGGLPEDIAAACAYLRPRRGELR